MKEIPDVNALKPYNFSDLKDFEFDRPGDIGTRKPFANTLLSCIDSADDNNVIAIDAAWGQGKTHFLDRFEPYLNKVRSKYRIVRIDAFENDYIDDPFIIIAAHLANVIAPSKRKSFLNSAKNIGKRYAPAMAGAIGELLTQALLEKVGMKDAGKVITAAIAKGTESYFDQQINKHRTAENAQIKFQKKLAEIAKEGKIVIFIDELDRCKPSFALAFIERLKHFFKIQGLVFVLYINRNQLERYVGTVYATGEKQSEEYLYKFVSIFLTFLTPAKFRTIEEKVSYKYAQKLLSINGWDGPNIAATIATLWEPLELSMRDIEKIVAEVIRKRPEMISNEVVTFITCIKMRDRKLFNQLKQRNPEDATQGMRAILKEIEPMPENESIINHLQTVVSAFKDKATYRINPHLTINGDQLVIRRYEEDYGYKIWQAIDQAVATLS